NMVGQLDSEGNGIDQLKLFKFRMHIICLIALNDIHHNTLYYLNANYLREDEHLARVITSSNAVSKSKKI
ncbi:hypothetical protein DERP_007041, partial [Dermatophagoides pteronyssinus]